MKAKDLLKLRFLWGSHCFAAHSLSALVLVSAAMLVTLGPARCLAADTGRSSAKPGNLMEMIEAQMKWREKVEAENRKLKEELELLRSESAVLSQTLKQMASQRDAATNHLRYLAINDYLMENRAAIAASLQKEWTPKRDTIFGSLWSQGRVLEFEVADIFLYQTNVVVSVGFVWRNPDSSGGAGRANIWMDPLNEYAVTGSSIQDQMRISAQELAALRESPSKPARTDERAGRAEVARVQESSSPVQSHRPDSPRRSRSSVMKRRRCSRQPESPWQRKWRSRPLARPLRTISRISRRFLS
jgi:hypothetical protein